MRGATVSSVLSATRHDYYVNRTAALDLQRLPLSHMGEESWVGEGDDDDCYNRLRIASGEPRWWSLSSLPGSSVALLTRDCYSYVEEKPLPDYPGSANKLFLSCRNV